MTPRENPHNEYSSKAGGDGCVLRFQSDGQLTYLNGQQVVAAVIPGPMIVYLTDRDVDPELGAKRARYTGTVRGLPSTQLLRILDNVPGSLG